MSSDRHVRTATRPCLPIRLKRVSARTSAHFARRASKTSSKTYARTAAVDSFRGLSDRRRTGMAITFLARILQVPRCGIGRLTRRFMRDSQPRSKPFPLTIVSAQLNRRTQVMLSAYLQSGWIKVGLALLCIGGGPLLFIIVASAAGLWPDPNPNPIGPGLLFFFTFWPAVISIVIGVVRVRGGRSTRSR